MSPPFTHAEVKDRQAYLEAKLADLRKDRPGYHYEDNEHRVLSNALNWWKPAGELVGYFKQTKDRKTRAGSQERVDQENRLSEIADALWIQYGVPQHQSHDFVEIWIQKYSLTTIPLPSLDVAKNIWEGMVGQCLN